MSVLQVPSEFQGGVVGDLSKRGGLIGNTDTKMESTVATGLRICWEFWHLPSLPSGLVW